MTTPEQDVRQAFSRQAKWCRRLGSPFTGLLCEVIGEELDGSTEVGRTVLQWAGAADALGDAVPLRVVGGLHALVRRGDVPALQAHYPPNDLPGRDTLWNAVRPVLTEHEPTLLSWLDHAPQTNEVGRSAMLMAGLMVISGRTGLPVDLYELGASAGLNLILDRYGYRLGDVEHGMHDAGLVLEPEWRGASPPDAPVEISSRRGVDLNPLDLTQAADRERLASFVWPDQRDRLARIEAAIDISAADPPEIDRGDAAAWLERAVSPEAVRGQTRVIMHSIADQYFPEDVRRRIAAHIMLAGNAASNDAPLAWLRFEIDPDHDNVPTLRLTMWPDGEESVLAKAHPHCQWIEWWG